MRSVRRGLVVVGFMALVATGLAGCNFNATASTNDPALNAVADANFKDLAAGRDDAVVARLSSENDAAQVKAQLPMLRTLVGNAATPEPDVVQFQKTTSTAGQFYSVLQDYRYPDRVAHVQTNFKAESGAWKVMGFNVNVSMTGAVPPAAEKAVTP